MEFPELPRAGGGRDTLSAIGHIAIALPDRAILVSPACDLQASGVKFGAGSKWQAHSLHIRDPNGYTVELLYERGEIGKVISRRR